LRRFRDELPEIENEEVHRRRARRKAGEHVQPAHLHSSEPAEGLAHVEVASAGTGKLRRDFRVTADDDGHGETA
jgi:hypothetical protein